MESLWKLTTLLEPASLALIATAVTVTFMAASRVPHRVLEDSVTLNLSQSLITPFVLSIILVLMFFLFKYFSYLMIANVAAWSAYALYFSLSPCLAYFTNPIVSRCSKWVLWGASIAIVAGWFFSGHWLLNNVLAISLCILAVSLVRLPNLKISALLLVCLFAYDIFWVFFSERFFGANVMLSVATLQASNPVRVLVDEFSLPVAGREMITEILELPTKLVFPRNLMGGFSKGYTLLGLGDMALPAMLLALVHTFDHQKQKEASSSDKSSQRGYTYIWYALCGYAIGLVMSLAVGILSGSPQPALLYLVPSTLGPVIILSWIKKELKELWEEASPISNDNVDLKDD